MRMAILSACALLAAGCSGANVLYLHSESDAKAMSEAIAGLEASKVSHLAHIDGEKAFLDHAHNEDVRLIIDRQLDLRDFYVARLFERPREMRDRVSERSAALFGADNIIQNERSAIIADAGSVASTLPTSIAAYQEDVDRELTQFRSGGGVLKKKATCRNGGPLEIDEDSKLDAGDSSFVNAQTFCASLRELITYADPTSVLGRAEVAAAACIGGATDPLCAAEYGKTVIEVMKLKALIETQNAAVKAVEKTYSEAKKAYDKAKKTDLPGVAFEKDILGLALDLDAILGCIGGRTEDALAENEEASAEEDKETKKSACETASKSELFTDISVRALFDALEDRDAAAAFSAGLRQKRAKLLEGEVATILGEVAAQKPGEPILAENKTAKRALQALRALGLLQTIIKADEVPSLSALSIALAANRAAADMASIEADFLKTKLQVLELKKAAMLSEVRWLASASLAAAGSRHRRALRRYATSWTEGRVQAEIADYELVRARRAAWIAREKAATNSVYDTLAPALAELGAYADGGVKPELIARILNVFGVSAIAAGVN